MSDRLQQLVDALSPARWLRRRWPDLNVTDDDLVSTERCSVAGALLAIHRAFHPSPEEARHEALIKLGGLRKAFKRGGHQVEDDDPAERDSFSKPLVDQLRDLARNGGMSVPTSPAAALAVALFPEEAVAGEIERSEWDQAQQARLRETSGDPELELSAPKTVSQGAPTVG